MSLHFLIDGYNAVKRLNFLKDIPILEQARAGLVEAVNARLLTGSRNNRATIVFDGKSDFNFAPESFGPQIKIVFSREGQTADDVIKTMVEVSRQAKQMQVVTDDKSIQSFTRGLGAKVMSVDGFFSKKGQFSQARQGQKKSQKAGSDKAGLTYQQQEAIKRELLRRWSNKYN